VSDTITETRRITCKACHCPAITREVVYHFTDTARLPWILKSGELEVEKNRVGNFPDEGFLWATRDPRGARSAAAYWGNNGRAYRNGDTMLVRFTLPAQDFESWRTVIARYPSWTDKHIAALEDSGRKRGCSPDKWQCRPEPLPSYRWLAIDCRSYVGHGWRQLPLDMRPVHCDGGLGLVIGEYQFTSFQEDDGITPVVYLAHKVAA
jgi:hypothetical protein